MLLEKNDVVKMSDLGKLIKSIHSPIKFPIH